MRVLSLCRDAIPCEFATRLAADAGLEVIKAELPGSDPLAGRAPGLYAWLTAGKARVACAPANLARLIAQCAAVVTDEAGRTLVEPHLGGKPLVVVGERDASALAAIAPGRCDEFLAFHAGGLGFITPRVMPGYPSAGPLCPDAHLVEFMVGLYGAIALFALLGQALRTGRGQQARIGYAGATIPLLRREVASVLYDNNDPHRAERIWKVSPAEIHRCSDGWVFVNAIEDHQWRRLCQYMGRADLAAHPDYATRDQRFAHADAISIAVDAFFATRPQSSWQEAQAQGVPVAPVNSIDTLLADPHLAARGFWSEIPVGTDGTLRAPVTPLARQFGPAKAPVMHAPVMHGLPAAPAPATGPSAPLANIRVLELTHVWSGPFCGQVLADLGAEVIRVENRKHLDIHRRGGPYAKGEAGLNRSGTWNAQNRGKLGCTLDVKAPEGRELFLAMVRNSDVVIENFAPGTLEKLGLGFEALCVINPRIVLLRLSGYGQTGPYRDSLAYGPMMDAATGLSAATTYADGLPRAVNGWAADIGGALYGCAAVTRALLDAPRAATLIDLSQFEAGVLFNAEALIDRGNDLHHDTGVLQAAIESAEADQWIAVSVRAGDELNALRALLGTSTMDTKNAQLEAALQTWCATRTRTTALAELHAAGIPAAPITTTRELINDPRLREGGTWLDIDHPEAGRTTCYGAPIRLADRPPNTRPAPPLGAHNSGLFKDLAGLSTERIDELTQRGIL